MNNRLTEGNIFKALIKLALPIMGTSFVQMAYNMTDMFWIGSLGSKSVAAVGTAGFFTWFGSAILLIPKIGAEICVAQSVGKKDVKEAEYYAINAVLLDIILAIIYSAILIIFSKQLIGFFKFDDLVVVNESIAYLTIVSIGMIFLFINSLFTGIFNGYGNSETPFRINSIGLAANMILDPIMIFGYGPFSKLGVKGAAIATITAQFIVTMVFIYIIIKRKAIFTGFKFFSMADNDAMKKIIKLGLPVAIQNALFATFAMFIARIIAKWGPTPVAVQNIGAQIEAISWMTAGGFSTALSAFVGQNYGAKRWDRIYKGFYISIGIVSIIGLFASCLLIFGARPIFSVFLSEEEAVNIGVRYLRILGLSQIFMCIEITTAGAFNGIGKTILPSVVGTIFTGLRVPFAAIISSNENIGLDGVWWTISVSSMFKGVILFTCFVILLKRIPEIVYTEDCSY